MPFEDRSPEGNTEENGTTNTTTTGPAATGKKRTETQRRTKKKLDEKRQNTKTGIVELYDTRERISKTVRKSSGPQTVTKYFRFVFFRV